MAYRRRNPISRASTFTENLCSSSSNDLSPKLSRFSTFKEDHRSGFHDASSPPSFSSSPSSSSSVAAQAVRSGSAYRESPISNNGESANKDLNSFNSQRFNRSQQGTPTVVENRTANIISGTQKFNVRRKGSDPDGLNQVTSRSSPRQQPQNQANQETQQNASRDVAMAMAAKAKLLVRELNTMKGDLAFAKERCAQLEEENKILRESHRKGVSPEEDDLIRLQLETLLAEKSRLANENSTYARENQFLRGIVDFHQLTMQDVVYVNEGTEEVMEVYTVSDSAGFDALPTKPSVFAAAPPGPANPTFLNGPLSPPSGSANPSVLNGLLIAPTVPSSTIVISPDIVVVPSSEDQKQDNPTFLNGALAPPSGSANPTVLNGILVAPTEPTSTEVVSPDVIAVPSSEDQKQDNSMLATSI